MDDLELLYDDEIDTVRRRMKQDLRRYTCPICGDTHKLTLSDLQNGFMCDVCYNEQFNNLTL